MTFTTDAPAQPSTGERGRIVQISVSNGGVPKTAVAFARVTARGVSGDRQRNTRLHGGPMRAVCLYALEVIERLRAEGHPIVPGAAGENLTIAGLDFAALGPGDRLRAGESVVLELTSFTMPCKNIVDSFAGGDFNRISPTLHPGEARIYARVLEEGELHAGDLITLLPR